MKYVKEYLKDVIKVKPLGKLSTKDEQELNGMSGEMVYIDGKCTDIFISHADYANWLESLCGQTFAELYKEDEQNLNACLDYIPDECLKSWLTNIIHVKYKKSSNIVGPKFKVGDIISNYKVVYRVDDIKKNCLGQDCYFLVNVEREKNGTAHIGDMGKITWLCEQVDRQFWISQ